MKPFVIIDAPQRSPEWFRARAGRITGSVAHEAFARLKSGGYAASRTNLKLRLVLERLTGRTQEGDYVSPAMQAGIDREPLAFKAYEALTGEMGQRSGFLSHVEHMAGCSLDGHLGDFDKLLSIKCRQPAAHLECLRHGKIPPDALTQIRHELWITGAREHDYFSWNPEFPEDLQARVITVRRADVDMAGYEKEVLGFLAEVAAEEASVRTMSNVRTVLEQAVSASWWTGDDERDVLGRNHADEPEQEVPTPTLGWCHTHIEQEQALMPAVTTRAHGRWYMERPLCQACANAYDAAAERQWLARMEG